MNVSQVSTHGVTSRCVANSSIERNLYAETIDKSEKRKSNFWTQKHDNTKSVETKRNETKQSVRSSQFTLNTAAFVLHCFYVRARARSSVSEWVSEFACVHLFLENRIVVYTSITFIDSQLASHSQFVHLILPMTLSHLMWCIVRMTRRMTICTRIAIFHTTFWLLQRPSTIGAN